MIVSPFAIDGRPLDNGNKTFSVCPICPCTPPKTCEDLIAYLHILETELSGTYYNTGYIFRSLDDPLNPSYQHFLGALTFVYDGISYVAFVTCACSFVVWKWNDKYSIHEQSDACTCLADMLMAMYVTQVGGTEYGEGFMYSPPKDEGGLATKTAHGGAVIFTFGEQNYIFLRSCDKEDCLSFNIREMTEGEYYREMSGVCDCPEIIDFALTAEENGYTIFGPSLLYSISATYNGQVSFSYRKVAACYFDAEVEVYNEATNEMETGGWRYANCGYCTFGIERGDKQRMDFSCDGCVDIRKIPFPGLVAEQYGSHTCYKGTFNGVQQRKLLYSGTPTDVNNGGGYVDFRTRVALYDIDGKRYLVSQWITGNELKPLRTESFEVPIDTVFDGYAELLKYQRGSDGVIGYHSDMPIYGIPGDTYGTYLVQNYETKDFYTEEEAIAFSNTESAFETSAASVFNYFQIDLESIDKRTPVCDYDIIGNFVRHLDYGGKRWRASNKGKYGIIYSFRALETNRGFLLLDGTYITEIYQPTLSEVQTCADYSTWKYGHSRWSGGYDRVVDRAGAGEEDPICQEIDPEEFE